MKTKSTTSAAYTAVKVASFVASVLAIACLFATEQAEGRTRKSHAATDAVEAMAKEALTEAPKADEVCFSPDEPCDIKLVKFVEAATKSLDVAIYDINLGNLVNALIVASHKIPVRIVVDARQSKEKNSLVETLLQAGIVVKFGHQRGIMHNKFIVRDGEMIEAGSFNYTNHAATSNNENQVYLATPAIVSRYRDRFEHIWADGKPIN